MTFKKENVTFINHSEEGFMVEITAGDGSRIKRHVEDADLAKFCGEHGFDSSQIEEDLAALKPGA